MKKGAELELSGVGLPDFSWSLVKLVEPEGPSASKGFYGVADFRGSHRFFNLTAYLLRQRAELRRASVRSARVAYTRSEPVCSSKGQGSRLQVGDASTVFWAEKKHEIESVFSDLFGKPAKGEPDQESKPLVAIFRAPESGASPQLDPEPGFLFWGWLPMPPALPCASGMPGAVGEVAGNTEQHFDD